MNHGRKCCVKSRGGTSNYILRVKNTNPLVYWENNQGSGTAIPDSSGNGYDGTGWTNITWRTASPPPMGGAYPEFDGVTSYGHVRSDGLAGVFDYNEGCILIWLRVANVGVWTDSQHRYGIYILRDGFNSILIGRNSLNNQLRFRRNVDATPLTIDVTGLSDTNWFSAILSWSTSSDELKAFINGSQVGSTLTGLTLATVSGIAATSGVVGALNTTPVQVWSGWAAQCAIWNTPVTPAIQALGSV